MTRKCYYCYSTNSVAALTTIHRLSPARRRVRLYCGRRPRVMSTHYCCVDCAALLGDLYFVTKGMEKETDGS